VKLIRQYCYISVIQTQQRIEKQTFGFAFYDTILTINFPVNEFKKIEEKRRMGWNSVDQKGIIFSSKEICKLI
jgi:hypothetical protein